MKIKLNGKYKTRGGRKVNLLAISENLKYSIIGEVDMGNGIFSLEQWTESGEYEEDAEKSDWDLVEDVDKIVIGDHNHVVTIEKGFIKFSDNNGDFIVYPSLLKYAYEAYKKLTDENPN